MSRPVRTRVANDQHHRRIEHRALDAALDLRRLLDLVRDAVEHLVQDSGRLAGLDHRDEEAVEDLRMPRASPARGAGRPRRRRAAP